MVYPYCQDNSKTGRSDSVLARAEQLRKQRLEVHLPGGDLSNDQLSPSGDQSSPSSPPADDPDEGYNSDGSFATCLSSLR